MMKRKISRFLLLTSTLLFSHISNAASGTGLLFNLSVSGADVDATTTIPNHFYPFAGVKVNTPGYELELVNVVNAKSKTNINPSCALNGDGFCVFPVSDSQAQTIRVLGQGGLVSLTLCLNANHPVSCQLYTVSISSVGFKSLAVIQNQGNHTVSRCALNRDGFLSQCKISDDAGLSLAKTASQNIQSNDNGTQLYQVKTADNQVSVCELNHGVVGACRANSGNGVFNAPSSIALDEYRHLAYVTNSGDSSLSICHILANGDLSACTRVSDQSFVMPTSIRLS